ncbi:hypothetical protein [Achromobacter denitrificans]|uniref:hypothetical protein n=1 Tax=Achromobacter denitrificans TaxID=32002 RepID=UPI001C8B123A|nr:hypothetical protein [Achromobacter denitrificans]
MMHTLWRTGVLPCLTAIIVAPTTAGAFDAEMHPAYTKQAVTAYRHCGGGTLSEQQAEAYADGTEAEDSNLVTLGQRAANWHFHNRDGKLQDGWFVNRSLDVIFAKRNDELEALLTARKLDTEKIYKQAGRVLHYIQDMSVPAHVVPVYHAKLPLLGGGDPFDAYQRNAASPPFSLSAPECAALRQSVTTGRGYPQTLLQATALATLQRIGQPGPTPGAGEWERYWIYPSKDSSQARDGWGSYGDCEFKVDNAAQGCKGREQLDALFDLQYRDVLMNSVRMLVYVERRLAERQQKPGN